MTHNHVTFPTYLFHMLKSAIFGSGYVEMENFCDDIGKDIQSTPSIVTPVIVTFYYIVTPVECSKHFIIKIYPI